MTPTLNQFNYQIHEASKNEGSSGNSPEEIWVFLHGLMGYSQNWMRIVKLLGKKSLTLDQRGHGKSFKPDSGYAPEDFADDLKMILASLNFSKIRLVGHSMGGRNAIVFTARYPELVSSLVIEDMGPGKKEGSPSYYQKLFSLIPEKFESRATAKAFLLGDFNREAVALGQPASIGAYFYSNLIETAAGDVDFRFSRSAMLEIVRKGHERDFWPDFESIKCPTLVVRGADSTELSSAVFQQMLARNPRAQGVEIPNAGHWVHADQPQLFADALLEFDRA